MPRIEQVEGLRLLPVMATKAEFGDHLQRLIDPLICGVGPVEAGLALAETLAQERPDLVVCLGSAGSATLQQAQVYQAVSVSYRDMDASAFGFEPGLTPFLGLPAALPLEPRINGLPSARLSTGANVVDHAGYADIDADMVDMETFALARACHRACIPLICLRGISDGAEPVSGYADWTRYLHLVDENLADAFELVTEAIRAGLDLASWKPPGRL